MRVVIGRVALVIEPGARDQRARVIAHLDLDPGVLDVEHAAREAMADEQVAHDDIELEPRSGRDRRAVGG